MINNTNDKNTTNNPFTMLFSDNSVYVKEI